MDSHTVWKHWVTVESFSMLVLVAMETAACTLLLVLATVVMVTASGFMSTSAAAKQVSLHVLVVVGTLLIDIADSNSNLTFIALKSPLKSRL